MLWPVAKALLGHYRRYPFQIVLVWLGLTLGVSLLVGVTAINEHAQRSYEHGERLFTNPFPNRIRPKHSANKIPQGFYIQLRREGFHECAPFDTYRITDKSGVGFSIIGMDPVAMLSLQKEVSWGDVSTFALMKPPFPILVGSELAEFMGWQDGDNVELIDGREVGPVLVDKNALLSGTRILADMSLVRKLGARSGLSIIACEDMPDEKVKQLRAMLPNGMVLSRNTKVELESLTKAFHMNLTAMGMLSFVVGLFIFYQAMSLSLIQRQPLVGILRQTGVSGWTLAQALTLELVVLVLVGWGCGNVFGLLLANQLIPSVSASLADLYDANVGLAIDWSWEWSQHSLYMTLLGAGLSCAWPLIRLLRSQSIRLSTRLSLHRFTGAEFSWQAMIGCVFVVAAIAIYQAPKTQESGYVIMALMLISVALFTPYIIWKFFESFSFSLRWVKARWFFADAAASMSYRGVATMAFMLAMAANVGVETMVGSFRDTTDKWLTQRLSADFYIYPSNNAAGRMSSWFEAQPEVAEVWWRWETEVATQYHHTQIVSTGDSTGELDSLTVKIGIPNYWYHLHHSKGVMISESMALKLGYKPGDYIELPGPMGPGWLVTGVYYDYGNPYHQVLVSHRNWLYAFAGSGDVGLGVKLLPNTSSKALQGRMESVFRINEGQFFDNKSIHSQAMNVFDRTFAIADTLGNITLVIAVFGIFFATIAGELSRQRHMSLLRCFGISGFELILIGGGQLLVFGLISAMIAVPLGIAMAHLIVEIVLKESFGWSLQLQLIPWEYAETILMTLVALVAAGSLPIIRMLRHTPVKSLRDAL